jgi:xylan 1,4-beta-xylosidase
MRSCALFLFAAVIAFASYMPGQTSSTIDINASGKTHPLPHFWEQAFGSGRAVLSLRDSYRQDLREVKKITDFKYVRFHAIFHDEVGFYDEDATGKPVYNFSYIDQIYDGLLANGVRPFIELSFMPKKLAGPNPVVQAFWYKPFVSPPKDISKWDDMIYQFTRHLIERYGEDEVAQWYFEVWNEPNLDFWDGEPRQATYFDLYDHTARAVKRASPRLRIGGPATAQAAWAVDFIRHCAEKNVPVDFFSTHVYGNDTAQDVFHTDEKIPRDQMVCRAVENVHKQILASPMPKLPLFWSEFNAAYNNEQAVTDSTYMGPWLANTIRLCDGKVDMMAYWTFSDVFEEQGVVKEPFYGGFGLLAAGHLPKPAFNAFALMHRLGTERIDVASDSVLATVRDDGTLAVAVWNMADPGALGVEKQIPLRFSGVAKDAPLTLWRVDDTHGNVLAEYVKLGSPHFPSREQAARMWKAGTMVPPSRATLVNGELTLTIPPHGLVLVEIGK